MYNPEVTRRIIYWSIKAQRSGKVAHPHWTYGPKAMKRRIDRCCVDNPECKMNEECYYLYVKFVNATENPKEPQGKYERPKPSAVETYPFYGPRQLVHVDIVRC